MTGRVLTGYRHDLQITSRFRGHTWAVAFGAALAAIAVLGFGL